MNILYLTNADLQELESRFPQATAFLRGKSLEGEKRTLQREIIHAFPKRKAWIQKRLKELELLGGTQ